ncbi:hypothetical protein [Actinoplanes sp. M2I2]|uniref:hypothetical protein n=1 Tax=Actinoplanes sp. M2I2 TaxID=1734444 RepID=UPI0020216E09|nr:hypothetical protein [Actinoplanes sp. M2I2]
MAVLGRPDATSMTLLQAVFDRHAALELDWRLVDLTDLGPADQAFLAGSALAAERNGMASGSVMMLGAAMPEAALAGRSGSRGRLSRRYARTVDALAVGPLRSPSFTEQVLPLTGGARQCRDLITQACLAWSVPHLLGDATLLASELISYATEHTSSLMTMTTMLDGDSLYLWVRGAAQTRRPPPDRLALFVVHSLADHWGILPDNGDTLLWAALPIVPAFRAAVGRAGRERL